MKSFGVIDNPVEYTLGVYFHHCAHQHDLPAARGGGPVPGASGRDPSTGLSVVQAERAKRIKRRHADLRPLRRLGRVRLPGRPAGKSGVGGGILAVAPGKASIAVWAPGLDAAGNSHLGRIALERLTKRSRLVDLRRVGIGPGQGLRERSSRIASSW